MIQEKDFIICGYIFSDATQEQLQRIQNLLNQHLDEVDE